MLFGRTPVLEVLAFLDEELAWGRERGLAAIEADALLGGPYLYPRLGRFDEARERLERSKELHRELGIRYGLAEAHSAGAQMEMIAGDPKAAERELRGAIDIVLEMGATRYVRMYRVGLARVLLAQGRDEDALAELEATQDVFALTPFWLVARARVHARRGEFEEAVTLARAAADAATVRDDITLRAIVLTDAAEALHAAGDLEGAADALERAIELHEEKGNVLPAQQCRELLAAKTATR
jgi:tetratricopeptide (TPR) repeat protein